MDSKLHINRDVVAALLRKAEEEQALFRDQYMVATGRVAQLRELLTLLDEQGASDAQDQPSRESLDEVQDR